MKYAVIIVMSLAVIGLRAQSAIRPWEQYLEQVMTMEDAESDDWQQTYDLLCELEQQPINLNKATREELEQFPFLSAQQVEGLMAYLYRYGPIKSTAELQMIREIEPPVRQLLSYFVYLGDGQQHYQLHHELTATAKVPLSNGHWFRYQLQVDDRLKAGLVGDQDADEPFFEGRNRWGYDYYSPYVQLNRWGRVEALVLGNYRVSMGMGLVMNNSFSLGKIAMLQQLGRSTNTLRAHSSRTEGSLQGAGITVRLGRSWHITAFGSYAPMDATLNSDGTARTILTSGYHRTESELAKKHNLHALKTGGSLRYQAHGLHVGLNGLYVHLDRPLHPNTKLLYNLYKPQGSDFVNMSVDYGYTNRHWAVNGETALDGNGHVATINSVSLAMDNGLTLMALQRFYAYRYASIDAQSFSDGGHVQNESGMYVGVAWQPSARWQLMAYTDYSYFPWVRYGKNPAQWTLDHLVQGSYTNGTWQLNARYRMRPQQREHRARLGAAYDTGHGLSFSTQLDGNYHSLERERGGMVSGRVAYTYKWLKLQAGTGYYHTDSYQSRVFLYENAPLYTYAMQQFYGQGLRYWLMLRANAGRCLLLTAKLGVDNPQERKAKTDMMIQVRLKI